MTLAGCAMQPGTDAGEAKAALSEDQPPCMDSDGDGYDDCAPDHPADTDGKAPDCDDGNAAAAPGAQELCNGVDDDCDGLVDEECAAVPSWGGVPKPPMNPDAPSEGGFPTLPDYPGEFFTPWDGGKAPPCVPDDPRGREDPPSCTPDECTPECTPETCDPVSPPECVPTIPPTTDEPEDPRYPIPEEPWRPEECGDDPEDDRPECSPSDSDRDRPEPWDEREYEEERDRPGQNGFGSRTIGFWKNHSCAVWAVLPVTMGGETFETFAEVAGYLSMPPKGDHAIVLGHQLLGALLNAVAFDLWDMEWVDVTGDGVPDTIEDLLEAADAAYMGPATPAQQVTYALLLDALNNAGDDHPLPAELSCSY